ncbi:methyltransferase-like protein 17, mitochondrial [Zeugodacus cucurbitae]|uniref:Methyltransferase-like protein 17, mitochondrial n=1 Tax=Zeugodacus cucurbitae TaxID=28588 RepID=A0A0A1WVI0_ZEUCU|nr:methyltransferase-like protein 17, mitochondrial [Zeugodacus cucurbitae]
MNAGFRLVSGLRYEISKHFVRNTCKIAVEVEPNLIEKLENAEIKARHHPGIAKVGKIEIPINLRHALERVIGDYPVKTLLKDCKQLDQYINSRHPPIEQEELNLKMKSIMEEVDRRMPPEKLSLLGEESGVHWRRKRDKLIKRMVAQRNYAWKPIEYGSYEALVYAIGRGAKEYGVLTNILNELRVRDKSFQPRSYFDFGAGVGTGMWAASNLWKDTIFEYYNVDSSRNMNDLSELILREGNENQQLLLRNVYYRQFLPALETLYDLVVLSYTLFELPSADSRKDVLLNLWKKCSGYMVIVEEGTRRGSELINEARDFILSLESEELKGHVFAPCSHNLTCPRFANNADRTPCNFEVGYVPLQLGGVKDDRHITRYSYVVLKKGEISDPTRKWPRLVRPTLLRSKHIICRMCTEDAKLQEVIFTHSKHGRHAYRCAKVSDWGDRLPIKLGDQLPTIRKTLRNKEGRNEDE